MKVNEELHKRIQLYIRGEMSGSDAHAFEKEMLEDPFLADAVEGLMLHKQEDIHEDIQSLNAVFASPKRQNYGYFKIAALLFFLLCSGLVIWLRIQTPATNLHEQSQEIPAETIVPETLEPEKEITYAQTIDRSKENIAIPKEKAHSDWKQEAITMQSTAPKASPGEVVTDAWDSSNSNEWIQADDMNAASGAETGFMNLLENPDVSEKLLAWAQEFQEPELKAEISYSRKAKARSAEKIEKLQTESPAEIPMQNKDTDLTPPSRTMIIKLIRDGHYELAQKEILRMDSYYPDEALVPVLQAALYSKEGKKDLARKVLKKLNSTPYKSKAEALIQDLKE